MNLSRATFAAVTVAAVFIPTAPAMADHGGSFVEGALNTAAWKVCRSGWPDGVNAADRALALIDASHVNPVVVSCTSGNQNVNVRSQAYPDATWYGRTQCTGTYNSTNHRCSSMSVDLNINVIATSPNPAKQWQKTACHELGHVGGLGHRPVGVISSCLAQGDSPPVYTIYDSHDINSLNHTY